MIVELHNASANKLPLDNKSVQMVVTSPPYYGLRTYHGDQATTWSDGSYSYGAEPTIAQYILHTVEVLHELKRVLKDDGVVFWNVGDCYSGSGKGPSQSKSALTKSDDEAPSTGTMLIDELPSKNLCLIPQRVAIAAQEDGWIVRDYIIWRKPNCLPSSVKDRCTGSYEPILMLAKSQKYYWDHAAMQEPADYPGDNGMRKNMDKDKYERPVKSGDTDTRNTRNVWDIPTKGYTGAHMAPFPVELPTRCIKAASRPDDVVLDPFGGSGTTGVAAAKLGRNAVLCDINYGEGSYQKLAEERIGKGKMWESF